MDHAMNNCILGLLGEGKYPLPPLLSTGLAMGPNLLVSATLPKVLVTRGGSGPYAELSHLGGIHFNLF